MDRWPGAVWDAVFYAASAIVAIAILLSSDAPLDLLWARLAIVGYAAGGLGAWLLYRRRARVRARAILASAVFAAVAVVPTVVHANARAHSATDHVKSDVLVVEQAAASLMNGVNPYTATLDRGSLAGWPAATKTHVPYLPAILAFGVPRAAAGPAVWTDARVVYLALTLAITVPSIMRSTTSAEARLRAFQVMLVLVTGAPLVFTSGKELMVLALLLATLVALERRRAFVAGASAGFAAAVHQLPWMVLPLMAFVRRNGSGAIRGWSAAALALVVEVAVIGPFLAWDAGAFLEDTVLFPLGFGQPGGNTLVTPGGLVASAFPTARWTLVLVTTGAVAAYAVATARRGLWSMSDVARAAGTVLLVVLLLAPRARLAYFAFPLNLLVWSRLLLSPPATPDADLASSSAPKTSPSDQRGAQRHDHQRPRQERTAPYGAGERVPFLREPDVEDQYDHEERDVSADGRPDDTTRVHRNGSAAARPRHRPPPGEDRHRDEDRVGRDQRRQDRSEHDGSAPKEERPPADE